MKLKEKHEQSYTLMNCSGRKLHIKFRPCVPEDADAMIDCIREEYGETYFKRHFYKPEYLQQRILDGSIFFMVAETTEGEIAGMLILKSFYPEESMCEVASQIFKKSYRGYHMATPFFKYAMEILMQQDYSAAYCLPVVFHNITQRLLYRMGFRATGFILNVFDMEKIQHSYENGRNEKHSQGVQIMAMNKKNAGLLYVPDEHREKISEIYDSLGVKYTFAEAGNRDQKIQELSVVSWKNDAVQSNCEITVQVVGTDLWKKIAEIEQQYQEQKRQTFNVFLNMNDIGAVYGYEILVKAGYYFTGIKPLCSEREYMIMHHSQNIKIYGEDYVLTEEFRRLMEYIEVHRPIPEEEIYRKEQSGESPK